MDTFKEKMNNAGNKVKRFLLWTFSIIFVLALAIFLFFYFGTYSEGVRAGTVLKLSKRGVMFKTWEGQLDVDAFGSVTDRKGNNYLKQSFEFSVEDSEQTVIDELQTVALSGERVNLHYKEKYFKVFWKGETNSFIYKVERLGK